MPPTVALFRAPDDARAAAEALAERGVEAVLAPVIAYAATGALPPDGAFDFAVATSPRAIELASSAALAAAAPLKLYVVGEKTAAAARAAGLAPEAPASEIAALLPRLPQGRALYLAGRDRKPDLEAAPGRNVAALVVYEARAREAWTPAEAQAVASAQAALHYSERSAALACALARKAGVEAQFRRLVHVGLSRAAIAPLLALNVRRAMWPRTPTEAALLDTLENVLGDLPGL